MQQVSDTSTRSFVRQALVLDLAQARRQVTASLVDEIATALESRQSSEDRAINVVVDRLLDKIA